MARQRLQDLHRDRRRPGFRAGLFRAVYGIPIKLNPNWNLITRPILPVIYQPPFFSGKELQALEENCRT